MLNNDPTLDTLVHQINGTTGLLSRLITRKCGLVILLVISTAIALKFAL